MNPKLILLHGKARSGKGEISKYLCERYGYVEIGFADYLKELAITIFGWTQEEIYKNRTPESRKFMQFLGTEIGRAKDPNFWIKKLEQKLDEPFYKNKNIVISDVRFKNEAEWGKSKGGQVWLIMRPYAEELIESNPEHLSENDLKDWYKWDQVISNDKTIEDLTGQVDKIMLQEEERKKVENEETYAILLSDIIDVVAEYNDFNLDGDRLRILASGLEKLGWGKGEKLPKRKWSK